MSEYAVKAENHAGEIVTIMRGFSSRDEAEDWPIKARDWRRFWVENLTPPARALNRRTRGHHGALIMKILEERSR